MSLKGLNVHCLDNQQCDDDDGMKIKDKVFCWMLGQSVKAFFLDVVVVVDMENWDESYW